MTKIYYKLAEMFPRILSTNIAKIGLTPKTQLPGTWLIKALKFEKLFWQKWPVGVLLQKSHKLIWYVEMLPLGYQ